jgi:hypothetical protein
VIQTDQTYYVCVALSGGWIETHPTEANNNVVVNMGPHNPDTSGTPDEGRYCWAVTAASPNRAFGVYQFPGE